METMLELVFSGTSNKRQTAQLLKLIKETESLLSWDQSVTTTCR